MIETNRLILDLIKPSDKEDYFINISHDKKVLETFMVKYTETIDDLVFDKYINNERIFAIRFKTTKKLIGIIDIVDDKKDYCEIGYAIGSKYWNKGYVTEAARAYINYLFEVKNYKKIIAGFFVGNFGSKRVMEKCGMSFARFAEEEIEYKGEKKDVFYYEISNEDFIENINQLL